MFATWCTATRRQRINANGFNTMWFILLKQKTWYQKQLGNHNYIYYVIILSCEKLLTLFALILLHHLRLTRSSLSLPMLPLSSLSTDCLSFLPPGGRALPHPLSPSWPHFPQVPGNSPHSCRAHWSHHEKWLCMVIFIYLFFLIFQNIKLESLYRLHLEKLIEQIFLYFSMISE